LQSFPIHHPWYIPAETRKHLKTGATNYLNICLKREYFDSLTFILSLDEPLPGEPKPLPSKASHLTIFFLSGTGERGSAQQLIPSFSKEQLKL